MGSIVEHIKCPVCSGVMVNDVYYRSGEEYANCLRCGIVRNCEWKRNESNELIKNDKGQILFDHVHLEGYGVYGIYNHEGSGQVGVLNKPITEDMIEEFRQTFENEVTDKDRSYVAKWEDGKQIVILGEADNLLDMVCMDFDAWMSKMEEEAEAEQAIPVKGLDHLTKDELSEIVSDYMKSKLNYVGEDFRIIDIRLVGSRVKETEREDSDLDIAFVYEGDYGDPAMCDTLNMEPLMIDDFKVDFIPYSDRKGSSIAEEYPSVQLSMCFFYPTETIEF